MDLDPVAVLGGHGVEVSVAAETGKRRYDRVTLLLKLVHDLENIWTVYYTGFHAVSFSTQTGTN